MPMLQDIFYWILNMSIMASFTAGIIVLIRQIKQIPRRILVFLWLIPSLRFLFPLGINSPFSLMTLVSKFSTKTVVVYEPVEGVDFSMTNSVMAADSYFPITYKVNILEDIFRVGSVIWIVVAALLFLTIVVSYITSLYEIKDYQHLRDNIYISEKASSPAVYGIIAPKIVLPMDYHHKNTDFVILHEKTHIRGAHNLWRMLAFVTVVVHWFNPLCWLFLKLFLADLELACDENVLVTLGETHAKEYAHALVDCKEEESLFASSFGGAKLSTRIRNILSFKRLTWFSLTAFIALVGIMFYVLLTNAG